MRKTVVVVLASAVALCFCGCGKKNCEDLCECILEDAYNFDFDEEECVDECTDDYWEDKDCRHAIREFLRCTDDEGCTSGCSDETDEVWDYEVCPFWKDVDVAIVDHFSDY